jgi:hypothetical protein
MAVYGAGEVLEFNPAGIQVGRARFPGSAARNARGDRAEDPNGG